MRDDCLNFSEFCVLTNAFTMLQALPVPLLVFIWCQTLYAPKQRTTSPTIAALTNFRKLVCPNMTTENSKNCTGVLIETEAWVRGDLGSTYVSYWLQAQSSKWRLSVRNSPRWSRFAVLLFIDEGSYEDCKLKSVTKRKFWNFEEEIKRVKYG